MYSIIFEGKIIDVVQKPTFIKVLPSGHIAFTDKSSANGIKGSDNKTLYTFEATCRKGLKVVTINEISENEFNRLKGLLNSDQVITADKDSLDTAVDNAISSLSETCNARITEGFSLRLSDNKKHHFRLTAEDQLNLLNLENQFNTGIQAFVYHATGELCQVFTREDFQKIIKAYRKHVLYHTTYFNVAKQYLKSLTDISKVVNFSYGISLAWTIKDPTIRKILQEGDANK